MKQNLDLNIFFSKYTLFILVIMLIFLFGITHPIYEKHVYSNKNNLQNKVIVIDPGHGGIDGGASVSKDMLEKEINLQVAQLLKSYLEKREAKVFLTRESDVSLESKSKMNNDRYHRDLDARCEIINGAQPDLFISVHTNCMKHKTQAKGAIVFHDNGSESKELSKAIANSINEHLYKEYLKSNELSAKICEGDYFIFRNTKSLGVLIEVGFLSNKFESNQLKDPGYREALALAITEGIDDYLQYESIEDTIHEFNLKLKNVIFSL